VSNQHPIDQLLTGWIEDGPPDPSNKKLKTFFDKEGREYYYSNYTEHKYKGWYWNEELRAYQRWQDMMDWYETQSNT